MHTYDITKEDLKVDYNNALLSYSKIQECYLQSTSTCSAYQGDFSSDARVLYLLHLNQIQIFKFIPSFLKALLT